MHFETKLDSPSSFSFFWKRTILVENENHRPFVWLFYHTVKLPLFPGESKNGFLFHRGTSHDNCVSKR